MLCKYKMELSVDICKKGFRFFVKKLASYRGHHETLPSDMKNVEPNEESPDRKYLKCFIPFDPNDAIQMEPSHLIGSANQNTGFYMKCITKLKWV